MLPDFLPGLICQALAQLLSKYASVYRFVQLPTREYLGIFIARQSFKEHKVTVFEQLNSAHAKRHEQNEVSGLLEPNGIGNVRLFSPAWE